MKEEYICIKSYPGVKKGSAAKILNDSTWFSIEDNSSFLFNVVKSYFIPEFWKLVELKPLFCTKDGKWIYSGDTCFQTRDGCAELLSEPNEITAIESILFGFNGKYMFHSTLELAQEYIDLNKQQYSLQNILNAKLFVDDIDKTKFAIDITKLKN